MHIIKSEKKTGKSLIDGLSKRLLKSEFKSDHSIKSKCLNGLSKKYCQITKHEKHKIENKTNKARKKNCNNVLFSV